jgi:hypothetical protein
MKQLLFIIPLLFIISCDYAKQQSELTELKLKNIDLQKQVNRYKTDSLFKSAGRKTDPHRIKAIRMIDSLKLKDPETLEELDNELNYNSVE